MKLSAKFCTFCMGFGTLVLCSVAAFALNDSLVKPVGSTTPEKLTKVLETQSKNLVSESDPGSDQHFLIVYGYEGENKLPINAHTFASFGKVGESSEKWATISWLPDTWDPADPESEWICIFGSVGGAAVTKLLGNHCPMVSGDNQSLMNTLGWGLKAGRKLRVWGPVRISPELYQLGATRFNDLNNDTVQYLADDEDTRRSDKDPKKPNRAINCMHAVSDLPGHFDEQNLVERLNWGLWGFKGTRRVLEHYIEQGTKLDWFPEPVDLESYRDFTI